MILKYFKKKQKNNSNLYKSLYIDIIQSTKSISFNILKIKNVDFTLTFEVISILLFCIFFGYKNNTKNNFNFQKQKLMNLFISDIDHSLRLHGLDMTLGKYVKAYVKKFYFRLKELEKIFIDKDLSNFELYLSNYNLKSKSINYKTIKIFYNDLNILIKRCKNHQNPSLLFNDIFN